jgi:hypothetical protein
MLPGAIGRPSAVAQPGQHAPAADRGQLPGLQQPEGVSIASEDVRGAVDGSRAAWGRLTARATRRGAGRFQAVGVDDAGGAVGHTATTPATVRRVHGVCAAI